MPMSRMMAKRLPTRLRDACPTSRSKSAACRPKSRTARRTAITSSASLDGSRPAIYFINLKDVGDWPKYSLPSLTYHEGVPGHHLQISLAQTVEGHSDAPQDRLFSAYSKAGRSMPSNSPTSSAAIRGSSAPAICSPSCSAPPAGGRHRPPRQGLEPRAGDRLHGRGDRLRAPARPARSRALLHLRSARPAATRSATSPGSAPASRRREDARGQVRPQAVPRSARRTARCR